jgi:hypothetical protein
MTVIRIVTLAVGLLGWAHAAAAQTVKLEFHDGKVNLTTQNASVRAILTEWARIGGTEIVNAEKVSGPSVTLQLTDVAEVQALDVILRGMAGYFASLRAAPAAVGKSVLDRILIVQTAGIASAATGPAAAAPAQSFIPQRETPEQDLTGNRITDVRVDDEEPNRALGTAPMRVNDPAAPQTPQPDQLQLLPVVTTPPNPLGVPARESARPARPDEMTPVPTPTQRLPTREQEP